MAEVDSKLASEFVESPNCRKGRAYPITRVTIHHTATVTTARVTAKGFALPSRKASATYCVGNDGSIVQCVRESDMPWTSNSYDNDNRAITIEVSNSERFGQWPVGEKAMDALINLLVDICRRNPGIGRLRYTGDTTGNMTMHKWFVNTQCPGPYLAAKFPEIAEAVNKRLGAAQEPQTVTVYDLSAAGLPQDVAKRIADEIKSAGYSAALTAREVKTEPSTPANPVTAELAVGDVVTMRGGAPVYGLEREFQSWVYGKKLYVRAIVGDRITVSIYRSGAITGNVHRKYLTKAG